MCSFFSSPFFLRTKTSKPTDSTPPHRCVTLRRDDPGKTNRRLRLQQRLQIPHRTWKETSPHFAQIRQVLPIPEMRWENTTAGKKQEKKKGFTLFG